LKIKEYQCSGCVGGPFESGCYKQDITGIGCEKHCAGTMASGGIGRFFLGMPTGFCRLGPYNDIKLYIYEKFSDYTLGFDKFNIPCWKYFDGKATMVRGLMPRINLPFLYVFLGDYRNEINCLEITKEDLEKMD